MRAVSHGGRDGRGWARPRALSSGPPTSRRDVHGWDKARALLAAACVGAACGPTTADASIASRQEAFERAERAAPRPARPGSRDAASSASAAAGKIDRPAQSAPAEPRHVEASAAHRADGSEVLAPLEGEAPFVALDVPDHLPAVVALPLGATSPRPVVVATHGAGGTPEAHCAFWRELLRAHPFIVCPRGRPLGWPGGERGYAYPNHHALGREVAAALDALARRHPEHADTQAAVYAGYSQGATMGALALPALAGRFLRAVLVEGGFGEWDVASAKRWAAGGGVRVLFACGRTRCAEGARTQARWLTAGGVAARVVADVSAGHTYEGGVGERLREALPWLLEGDPRWPRGPEP